MGHELFCKDARLCFASLRSVEEEGEDDEEEFEDCFEEEEMGVRLLWMKIPRRDGAPGHEIVLWDSGGGSNFVRMEHALAMNFPRRKARIRVVTLQGRIQVINTLLFQCSIVDLDKNVNKTKTHR